MPERELTQEQFEQIIEDATYLQDEAEALRYVIDTIPYDQAPPEGQSIVEKLLFLDHLQINYFRPVYDQVLKNQRSIHTKTHSYFEESFQIDENKASNILKVLSKLAKHRAALINVLNKIPLIDWDRVIYKNNREITLADFTREMIRSDRKILKEIADLVMIFQSEMENQRKIKSRQKNQPE
ncbi:MAG: hypothetical protein WD035_06355 [Balneolaceae bacterium]